MYKNAKTQIDELRKSADRQLVTHLDEWRKLAKALGPSAHEAYREYEKAASELRMVSNGAAVRISQLQKDDLTPEEGRKRLIAETRDKARKEREAARKRMDAALTILETQARIAAMPKLDPKREAAARDELRLLTDSAADPARVLIELAQRDDELGGVAVSSYGESLLWAKGVRDAAKMHDAVRNVATGSAKLSADPERQAGYAAYSHLTDLRKATALVESAANSMLEDLGIDRL